VRRFDERTVREERRQLGAHLVLGGALHRERSGLAHDVGESVRVVTVGRDVAHCDAASGLFECEVAEVGQQQRELLPVVGPTARLRRALDEHDARVTGRRGR